MLTIFDPNGFIRINTHANRLKLLVEEVTGGDFAISVIYAEETGYGEPRHEARKHCERILEEAYPNYRAGTLGYGCTITVKPGDILPEHKIMAGMLEKWIELQIKEQI